MEFYDSSSKQLLQNSRFNQQIRHWSHDPSGKTVSENLTGSVVSPEEVISTVTTTTPTQPLTQTATTAEPGELVHAYSQAGYKQLISAEAFSVKTRRAILPQG